MAKRTLPSSTILANTAPQNTLLMEPIRNMVSGSSAVLVVSAILPKLENAAPPFRTARSMNPGTLILKYVMVPVKLTTSVRNLSSATADALPKMCHTATITAKQANSISLRNILKVSRHRRSDVSMLCLGWR
jgi:hypothetical protein